MTTEASREYRVREFMSGRVRSVDSGSSVREALQAMVRDGIGDVVVTHQGKPVGIFTEKEVVRAVAAELSLVATPLGDVMVRNLPRISPSQTSAEAARAMTEEGGRLLVYEDERLVGIVTATDILKVIFRRGVMLNIGSAVTNQVATAGVGATLREVVREMDRKAVGSVILTEYGVPQRIFTERDLLNKVLFLDLGLDTPASDVATFPMVTAEMGIDGRDVAGLMVSRHIKRLPLTLKGKVVGIITARDLVEAYAFPEGVTDPGLAVHARVRYGEACPICNSRIDSLGLCGCGAGGE